jgi:hypothetical protein
MPKSAHRVPALGIIQSVKLEPNSLHSSNVLLDILNALVVHFLFFGGKREAATTNDKRPNLNDADSRNSTASQCFG